MLTKIMHIGTQHTLDTTYLGHNIPWTQHTLDTTYLGHNILKLDTIYLGHNMDATCFGDNIQYTWLHVNSDT